MKRTPRLVLGSLGLNSGGTKVLSYSVSAPMLIALTTSYLAGSAVIATFYILLAPRQWFSALLALFVVVCSGSLAVHLWSTRILWG